MAASLGSVSWLSASSFQKSTPSFRSASRLAGWFGTSLQQSKHSCLCPPTTDGWCACCVTVAAVFASGVCTSGAARRCEALPPCTYLCGSLWSASLSSIYQASIVAVDGLSGCGKDTDKSDEVRSSADRLDTARLNLACALPL